VGDVTQAGKNMQNRETAIEVKVGALVLLAVAALAAFVLVLGDFRLGGGFEFKIHFNNAGGLKPGSDVAIAGMTIGNIKHLQFIQNKEPNRTSDSAVAVEASVWIRDGYKDAIREDSGYFITKRGVLGEPYIEIETTGFSAPALSEGAVVRGVDPPRLDLLVAKASALLTSLSDLLNDPDIHAKDLLQHTANLAKHLDELIVANRSSIDGAIGNLKDSTEEATYILRALRVGVADGAELRRIVANLDAATKSGQAIVEAVSADIDPIMANLSSALAGADKTSQAAARMTTEHEASVAAIIKNVEQGSAGFATVSRDAETIVGRIERGDGTAGALLVDREIYDDLKEMLRTIKQRPWKIIWKE
jgi:phospholipid/cholesterol/gamma-HCH transport system substrate-binding protein